MTTNSKLIIIALKRKVITMYVVSNLFILLRKYLKFNTGEAFKLSIEYIQKTKRVAGVKVLIIFFEGRKVYLFLILISFSRRNLL